jgi:general secretion pathway protein M
MRQLINKKISRRLSFLTFNFFATVFIVLFFISPLMSHFSERSEELSEDSSQLSHFRSIQRAARLLMARTEQTGDPFLPGVEERLASADLQASLKAITAAAGARFLGVHGLQVGQAKSSHMVAASLELEGPLQTIRDAVQTIETQTPFLFITFAEFRRASETDETIIHAELKVQGAMSYRGDELTEVSMPIEDWRARSPSTTAQDR